MTTREVGCIDDLSLAMEAIEIKPGAKYVIVVKAARPMTAGEIDDLNEVLAETGRMIKSEDRRVVFLTHGPEIASIAVYPIDTVGAPAA